MSSPLPTTPRLLSTSTPKNATVYRKTPYKRLDMSDDISCSGMTSLMETPMRINDTTATSVEGTGSSDDSGISLTERSDNMNSSSRNQSDSSNATSDSSGGEMFENGTFSKITLNTEEVVNLLERIDLAQTETQSKDRPKGEFASLSMEEYNDSDNSIDTVSYHTSGDSSKSVADAERATAANQYDHDATKESGREPVRGRPSACLFVASLSCEASDTVLHKTVSQHFAQWGELLSVKVLRDNENRPYAFVQYEEEEDAKVALENSKGDVLNGRVIRCEPARVNRSLYIRANNPAIGESAIKSLLSKIGEIEMLVPSVKIMKLQETPQSGYNKFLERGWFVKFAYRDDAIQAYAQFRDGSEIWATWAQNPDDLEKSMEQILDKSSIFIGHLSDQTDTSRLLMHFGAFGKILSYKLVPCRAHNGRTYGAFAFITYNSEKAAALAIERSNHSMLDDNKIYVQYKMVKSNTGSNNAAMFAPPPVGNYAGTRNWNRPTRLSQWVAEPGPRRSTFRYLSEGTSSYGSGPRWSAPRRPRQQGGHGSSGRQRATIPAYHSEPTYMFDGSQFIYRY